MPVSTRGQISACRDGLASACQDREGQPERARLLRDPHRGLRDKLRALTLMYEQQRSHAAARTTGGSIESRVLATHHPSVELVDSGRGKWQLENGIPHEPEDREPIRSEIKNHLVFPEAEAAKENREARDQNRIIVFSSSCPKKVSEVTPGGAALATRKLSLRELISAGMQSEGRLERGKTGCGVAAAVETGSQESRGNKFKTEESREGGGSRINVFVRLRPMAKKEKDAGSRCCVKIVNRKDVYLTEFASETDYLRLKRVRGRHFCFDASFPDSTSQQEVYATT